jgi:chromosome segregation ATPase
MSATEELTAQLRDLRIVIVSWAKRQQIARTIEALEAENTDLEQACDAHQADTLQATKIIWALKAQIGQLLNLSRNIDEHPEDYDGPCECRLCLTYAAGDGDGG